MTYPNSTTRRSRAQRPDPPHIAELRTLFGVLDSSEILDELHRYRTIRACGQSAVGRRGYGPEAPWLAYVASFHLNVGTTNDLIRRLQEDSALARLCGFGPQLPHRSTFNRFIQRLSQHHRLVESALAAVTDQLKELLPDLGETVAVDSTTVRSHSNPHRKHVSDPEASWTAKNSAGPAANKDGKEWHWGYKSHAVADAKYGIPLGQVVTTASRNDSPELPRVIEHTKALHSWFKPKVVIADRGYDALSNHEYVVGQGAIPIIHIRRKPGSRGKLYQDIYTEKGSPVCVGQIPMSFVREDPERGRLYRCRPEGCHLKGKLSGGSHHCADWVFEDPKADLRLFGIVRRDGSEWAAYYSQRWVIERLFGSLKASRRLERHCVRGLAQVRLHILMSSLTFQATALARVQAGEMADMRRQVRRVA